MAKVRARPETGTLYLDFSYRGVRCREQTTLPDSAENRRRLQALLTRVQKEIRQGSFEYTSTFPDSPRAARFARSPQMDPSQTAPGISERRTDVATPLFEDFSITWRAEMAPLWRRLHRKGVDAIFQAHLLPVFGEKRLSEISKAEVLAFRADLATLPGRSSKTLSPASINKIMGILRQCLTEASERFGLPDAFKGVKRVKARRPDVQPLSLDQVNRICSTVRADYRNYLTVRFFTGMRTGEINGLKWKYVDFEHGLIRIREVFSGGESEENAKTESSLRDIPMLPMVREALEHQREARNPESEYAFCTRDGNPIDAHNFANRIWYPLLRYLDIERRRPYQTRHTAATLMLASGENPEWIARLMGHANTQMLFTVYSRYVPNLTRRDGLAITGLVNSRTTATSDATARADAIQSLELLPAEQLQRLLQLAGGANQ